MMHFIISKQQFSIRQNILHVSLLLLSHYISIMESYSSLPKPWGRARIDYSAVNEYIHAHYDTMEQQQQQQQESTSYFPHSIIEKDVYNAREGVSYHSQFLPNPSLETCGFTLIHDGVSTNMKISDWTDWNQLCQHYFPHLDQTIRKVLQTQQNDDDDDDDIIQHLILWHPMLRGTDLNITSAKNTSESKSVVVQTASVASLVHIDTDIGALTLSQLLDLIQNNSITYSNSQTFCRKTIENDIESGCRFMVVNAWRNADMTNTPISSYPLGIYSTQYNNQVSPKQDHDFDNKHHLPFFPMRQPDPHQSHWYTYPNMTTNECLLFKQYDRDASKMSDLWHCALNLVTPQQQQQQQHRRSFDVRAFVILKEKIPPNLDRWSHRHPSKLTLEESGCFCDEQAEKHKISTS